MSRGNRLGGWVWSRRLAVRRQGARPEVEGVNFDRIAGLVIDDEQVRGSVTAQPKFAEALVVALQRRA